MVKNPNKNLVPTIAITLWAHISNKAFKEIFTIYLGIPDLGMLDNKSPHSCMILVQTHGYTCNQGTHWYNLTRFTSFHCNRDKMALRTHGTKSGKYM